LVILEPPEAHVTGKIYLSGIKPFYAINSSINILLSYFENK
jgi:hypothetical protein